MSTPHTKTLSVDQREYNLLVWFRLQMSEFVSPPERWTATITAEGLRVTGNFSKRHIVECDHNGSVLVDGVKGVYTPTR